MLRLCQNFFIRGFTVSNIPPNKKGYKIFTATRIAASATKIERKAIKDYAKIIKEISQEQTPDLAAEFNTSGFDKFGKKFLPYSKNIFKNGIYWLKSFKENYKITKKVYTGTIQAYKVYYGELFNQKRQKYVKKLLTKSMKGSLEKLKTGFNKEIKNTQNEFKTKTV